jgi:hypothetical protein
MAVRPEQDWHCAASAAGTLINVPEDAPERGRDNISLLETP